MLEHQMDQKKDSRTQDEDMKNTKNTKKVFSTDFRILTQKIENDG